ncbi:flagellar biosynthesis/type III secretory pathway chaperone [Legionella birminghamensis]|uniref:Flagella synthesis protein FlgN n=1 Tax=Legionella birminghamensis TaxID=28083 RepID=A0A378IIB8_9GAMM|nr:flagellar protein FlgN [Legionella birminghamensis]KTC75601.1 flagellar biosynthesis/type III secretory pathway chaperone [Legionella birminghamensis]STX31924.1 flagella synthesis protein FlgN [Legionella birminghamensis]
MISAQASQLILLLKNEINLLSNLCEVLVQEKDILLTRQFENLEKLANQKESLSEQLETSSKQRLNLLTSHLSGENPKQSLEIFLKTCSAEEAAQIKQFNEELANHLNHCRELNTVNGQVIVANMNTRQELVQILHGQNPAEAVNTYTSSGDLHSKPGSNHHEQA